MERVRARAAAGGADASGRAILPGYPALSPIMMIMIMIIIIIIITIIIIIIIIIIIAV